MSYKFERNCPQILPMLERRRLARTRVFAPAMVIPNHGTLNCIVRDITSFGARLEFEDAAVIPNEFDLSFDSARTLRTCQSVWRTAHEMGVEFCAPRPT